MVDIRHINSDDDYFRYGQLVVDAYPGFKMASTEEEIRKFVPKMRRWDDDPRAASYGLFRNGQMLGGMRMIDYRMRLFETTAGCGGLGMVAVDLFHKKEAVAKEMVQYYLQFYREREAPLAVLWPFRHDFYYQMGFGNSVPIVQYKFLPSELPKGKAKAHVRYLTLDDAPLLAACYSRFYDRHTGLLDETELNWRIKMESNPQNRYIGYVDEGGEIRGYLLFRFESAHQLNMLMNDLRVLQPMWEDRAALLELCAFMQSQFDQVNRVIFTTWDTSFHFAVRDPRDGSGTMLGPVYHQIGLYSAGAMYRVINTKRFFEVTEDHSFGDQSVTVRFVIRDSFMPENDGAVTVSFDHGRPHVVAGGQPQVEIAMNVAEFSSLVLGAISFSRLHLYGLAEISDDRQIQSIDRLFAQPHGPFCLTNF